MSSLMTCFIQKNKCQKIVVQQKYLFLNTGILKETWDGVVTSYHKKYLKELGVPNNVEAYIQSRVLKKTLESVSFDHRRGIGDNGEEEDAVTEVGKKITESTLLSV